MDTMNTATATATAFTFADVSLKTHLDRSTDEELDALDFGVIGVDDKGLVRRYNSFESKAAGLSLPRVLGHALFTVVAPCMNNFMVAQRFEDALEAHVSLDVTIDYVLTLRMRPVKVKLRLLASPAEATRYVLVHRPA
nr:phosphonate transporter [Methylibium sp.]